MGLFYELHKHHYGYGGDSVDHDDLPNTLNEGSLPDSTNAHQIFNQLSGIFRQAWAEVQWVFIETSMVLDCFGQEVDEKIKAVAEIAGWSDRQSLRNRYVNVPIAVCILISAAAFGIAYSLASGLVFAAGSLPALLSAGAVLYFATMTIACIMLALSDSSDEWEDIGGHSGAASWGKGSGDSTHPKESILHGNVYRDLINPADLKANGRTRDEAAI